MRAHYWPAGTNRLMTVARGRLPEWFVGKVTSDRYTYEEIHLQVKKKKKKFQQKFLKSLPS